MITFGGFQSRRALNGGSSLVNVTDCVIGSDGAIIFQYINEKIIFLDLKCIM